MSTTPAPAPSTRRRLSREERYRQLLDIAWTMIREEGTEALTLGRLGERAGVTKPVVYDHFGTRAGLLATLYGEYDARQNAQMDAALTESEASLAVRARVIATAYVDCVLAQGREIPGIVAALAGSPELEQIRCDYERAFMEKCRQALAPFAPDAAIGTPGLYAMLGAAESLSNAAAADAIAPDAARAELFAVIVSMVERGG